MVQGPSDRKRAIALFGSIQSVAPSLGVGHARLSETAHAVRSAHFKRLRKTIKRVYRRTFLLSLKSPERAGGAFALCKPKEDGIGLCNEKVSRPPRIHMLSRHRFGGAFSLVRRLSFAVSLNPLGMPT
jgi:hypothetical protein